MRYWCVVLCLLTAAAAAGDFRGSVQLTEFSRTSKATLLVYFNNENDFALVANGRRVALNLDTHLWRPGTCCAHRATPALSHDGNRIAFVKLVSTDPRREAVNVVDVRSGEMKEVFSAQAVWGISWSNDDRKLAVINDADQQRGHALDAIDVATGKTTKVIEHDVEVEGHKYMLSDYAPASWNQNGSRLAVEFRRAGFGANNSDAGAIVIWDLATHNFQKLADGVDPSWSPSGDSIAFFDASRKNVFPSVRKVDRQSCFFHRAKVCCPPAERHWSFPWCGLPMAIA